MNIVIDTYLVIDVNILIAIDIITDTDATIRLYIKL
jgi:hypothetical protein